MNFEKMIADISAMKLNLYDLALYQDGRIQTHCFAPCNRCNNSYSVAKAFIMTAAGLLWEEKKLRLSDTFYALFPDKFTAGSDPGWRLVTLEHAMTHRVGFAQDALDIDCEDATAYPTDDYLRYLFSLPLAFRPGQQRVYTDAAFYLLSRAVSLIAGERVDELLYRRVLAPLRYREIAWSRDPEGYPIGATGLYISAEDMVKLGALYMQGGVYGGKRLLSKAWVDLALENEYEFHSMAANGLTGKGGLLGQGLCFEREKGFAVAWHACQSGAGVKQMVSYFDGL